MITIDNISSKYPRKSKKLFEELQNLFHIKFPEDIDTKDYALNYVNNKIILEDKKNNIVHIISADQDNFYVRSSYPEYIILYVYDQKTYQIKQKNCAFPINNEEYLFFLETIDTGGYGYHLYVNKDFNLNVPDAYYSKVRFTNDFFEKYVEMIHGDSDELIRNVHVYTQDNTYYYSKREYTNESDGVSEIYSTQEAFSLKYHRAMFESSADALLRALSSDSNCGLSIVTTYKIEDKDNNSDEIITSLDMAKDGNVIYCMLLNNGEKIHGQFLSNTCDMISFEDLVIIEDFLSDYVTGFTLNKLKESINRFRAVLFNAKINDKDPDFISFILKNHTDFLKTCFYIYCNKSTIMNLINTLNDNEIMKLTKKPDNEKK